VEADGRSGPSNEDIVRDLWLAHREDRIDDLLELVDRDVRWQPAARPGRSLYEGHDGVRVMFDDMKAAAGGAYRFELEAVDEPEDGVVRVLALVVASDSDGDPVELPLELVITLRDGLVLDVVTHIRRTA
jgi:ketosteroid isomerase-like protein